MRIAIVGSRNWKDKEAVYSVIKELPKDTTIISGEAFGVDTFAKEAAELYNLGYKGYPANWKRYGNSAGFIRNQEIVDDCDRVIAFWDLESHGTMNTINLAHLAGKPIKIIIPENDDGH